MPLPDFTYHPDRVIYPMKRAKEDLGKNEWERTTWEDAYNIIEENIGRIKKEHGPESIVVFGGTGREGGPMCGPYGMAMIGTPNACYTQSSYACYIPRVATATYVAGVTYPEMDYAGGLPGRYEDPAYKVPEVMVAWGKEPLPSNGDGFFGHSVIDCMKRGSKLISIDPRTNWLATRATYHLALRPGTDTALGMAMLNIIIQEDLYDPDFSVRPLRRAHGRRKTADLRAPLPRRRHEVWTDRSAHRGAGQEAQSGALRSWTVHLQGVAQG